MRPGVILILLTGVMLLFSDMAGAQWTSPGLPATLTDQDYCGSGPECGFDEMCDEDADECLGQPGEVECDDDSDCNDGLYCNGVEFCNQDVRICELGEPACAMDEICDENADECLGQPGEVECDDDSDCNDGLYCNGVEFCNQDVQMCELGEPACAMNEFCDEDYETCIECFQDEDCVDEFRPLCSDGLECVQCFVDEHCPVDGDICEENECLPSVQSVCGLKVRPQKLNLKALFKTGEKRFKITGVKGEAGFDPYAPISFGGEYQTQRTFVKIKNKGALVKVKVRVPNETTMEQLPTGPLTVSIGECTGRIMVK